ncbi:MAG: TlpA family protein disulfide reductase [Candidatus Coatesbacteria bacterium]|nr:TlpA family protein disulfide reductase [Candidatus Coatesbacteria bacterium]
MLRSRIRPCCVVLLLLTALLTALLLAEEAGPVAKAAPEFTLKDVKTGKPVSLSDFKGKVVLIDFWATWCIPCRKAMKFYEELFREKHKEGLVILTISIDQREDKVADFLKKRPVSFPVLHDPDKTLMEKYGVLRIPTTFVIDKDGKIQNKYVGIVEKVLKARVEELLK